MKTDNSSDLSNDCDQHDIIRQCLHTTNFGELLLWSPEAAELLRRIYRIVGSATAQSRGTQQQTHHSYGTFGRLPVLLSFEESVLLLSLGIVEGVRLSTFALEVYSPEVDQLTPVALLQKCSHTKESRVSKHGLGRLDSCVELMEAGDHGAHVALKKKRVDVVSYESEELSADCSVCATDTQHPNQPFDKPTKPSDVFTLERPPCSIQPGQPPSPCRSISPPVSLPFTNRASTDPSKAPFVVLPDADRSLGLRGVVAWLRRQLSASNTCTSPMYINPSTMLLRSQVFADLWSRGNYLTTSSSKMCGDFLVYPGDPLLYHASHVICTYDADEPIRAFQLAAMLRVSNSIRKTLVLATCAHVFEDENPSVNGDSILYTSFQWTSFSRR
ncbi:unnamed protein product [Dicrocoelium dendriticum]|nr:unnamed protein product [Dicrocoelium dendriticum]CAH8526022.1 unnamed protein product [Dicrocoelium dendriticum]